MDAAKLKWTNRAKDSVLSAFRSLLPPMVNLIAAYLVIQSNGQAAWGAFVEVLIFISITGMFLSFGLKDYVLREASIKPQSLYSLAKSAIATRLFLLLIGILAAFTLFSWQNAIWLTLWLTAQWIYTGMDPLVNFEKKFFVATIAEILAGVGLIAFLLVSNTDSTQLVGVFSIAAIVKSIVLLGYFSTKLKAEKASINLNLLVASIPFMLLGASGMLQSKTDLYLVAALLEDSELGKYQVTVNFFIYLQALAALALLPFAKNLYRLPIKTIYTVSFKLGLLGLLACFMAMPILYWVLNSIYGFNFSFWIMIIGGLYVLPSWFFIPIVYKIIGNRKENTVIFCNVLGITVNLVITFLLIKRLGILGAFAGSAIAQWFMFMLYSIVLKRMKEMLNFQKNEIAS